jgi:hypothetical protein
MCRKQANRVSDFLFAVRPPQSSRLPLIDKLLNITRHRLAGNNKASRTRSKADYVEHPQIQNSRIPPAAHDHLKIHIAALSRFAEIVLA